MATHLKLKTRKQIYPDESIKNLCKIGPLYSGLGITLLRAFIVNSLCFQIYSYLNNFISKHL